MTGRPWLIGLLSARHAAKASSPACRAFVGGSIGRNHDGGWNSLRIIACLTRRADGPCKKPKSSASSDIHRAFGSRISSTIRAFPRRGKPISIASSMFTAAIPSKRKTPARVSGGRNSNCGFSPARSGAARQKNGRQDSRSNAASRTAPCISGRPRRRVIPGYSTSACTRPRPRLSSPSARAAPSDRSSTRPRTNGPRSLMVTMTLR